MSDLQAWVWLSALLDGAWKVSAMVALAALVVAARRAAGPDVRAGVWTAALLASALIVPATGFAPVSFGGWVADPTIPAVARPAPAASIAPIRAADLSTPIDAPISTHRATGNEPTHTGNVPAESPPAGPSWPVLAFATWVVVGGALLGTRLVGLLRLRRVVRDAMPVPPTIETVATAIARDFGAKRPIDVRVTSRLSGPATAGWLRPTILLPATARTWTAERVDVVLRHEIAHVARRDWIARQAALVVCALYWFVPLTWWASRRLNAEQEHAADRDVVRSGVRPSTYARHLLDIAREVAGRDRLPLAALPMARRDTMEGRLMAVLDERTPNRRRGTLLPATLILALVPALATVRTWSDGPGEIEADEVARGENRARIGELAQALDLRSKEVEAQAREIEELVAARIEPVLREMEPIQEELERRVRERVEPNVERMVEIEARMQPLVQEIERRAAEHAREHEARLAPLVEELERVRDRGGDEEQEAKLRREIETVAHDLRQRQTADREEMDRLHAKIRAMHEQMEAVRREVEPDEESLRAYREEMTVLQDRIRVEQETVQELHRRLQPHEREMRTLAEEMRARLDAEIRAMVEREVSAEGMDVTAEAESVALATSRIAEHADLDVADGVVTLAVSRARIRSIVEETFEGRVPLASADRLAEALSDFRAP